MFNKKVPQAVAMLLLAGALAAQDAKPTGGQPGSAATPVRAQVEIAKLLNEFLSRVEDPAMHERFWADDLIYTGSSGAVKSKADILKSMREPQNIKVETSSASATRKQETSGAGMAVMQKDTYSAEDVVVRQFGDTAVLNFRLVQHLPQGGINTYRNSGTFVKRNGQWQAVNWQATRVPPQDAATK